MRRICGSSVIARTEHSATYGFIPCLRFRQSRWIGDSKMAISTLDFVGKQGAMSGILKNNVDE